jgi:hypothetical protein
MQKVTGRPSVLGNLIRNVPVLQQTVARGNVALLRSLLGPAWRGLILQKAKGNESTDMDLGYDARFDWSYEREFPEMSKLYEAAKAGQWNATTDIDWSIDVDPQNPERQLLPDTYMPPAKLPSWSKLTDEEKNVQRHGILSWLLSQFLHGEQGALFAAAQVTEAVPWMDGKLFGSSQVMDEGRHVEVFHGYLDHKLEKLYEINDNLYVIIDALMTDSLWDIKFLGMQIMIEGLALGAFGSIRLATQEPLLQDILKQVITDEARHVHYGVLSLREYYRQISEKERLEREDWAFEVTVLLRNRFLAHEFYEEFYAHQLSRKEWDAVVLDSELMHFFRSTMFRRIIPNLKKIGLLTDRVRPRYEQLGLLQYEAGKAATELTATDLLEDRS